MFILIANSLVENAPAAPPKSGSLHGETSHSGGRSLMLTW
jgi:hypothetical protein